MIDGRVSGLFVYPIKSCRGIALEEARVGERGVAYDRDWMIVRPDGRFLTQRELPALATIIPELRADRLVLHLSNGRHELPLDQPGDHILVTIWKDQFWAFTQEPAIDEALSAHLGRPVRLVRFDPSVIRLSNPEVSPKGAHAAFSDEFPLLLTSTSSLDRLNRHLEQASAAPVPMARFRPNFVVEGLPAFAEDTHRLALVGDARLQLVSPCERCAITTTDQIDGSRHGPEPISTLGRVHTDDRRRPLFGWNVVPLLDGARQATLVMGAGVSLRESAAD